MIQNLWYLVAAYAVIWGVLFAYVFSVERRQKRLHKELAALEAGTTADQWKEVVEEGEPGHQDAGIRMRA